MASKIDIVNLALTFLGESRIMSIDDDTKAAREMRAVFEMSRDALLANHNWSFAKARVSLPASATPPAFQYTNKFPMTPEMLRLIMVGDFYVGVDLVNYRNMPNAAYTIEGRDILTDMGSPLNIIYVKRVTDTAIMPASFVYAFAARLGVDTAESLTASEQKKESMVKRLNGSISEAIRANAIELPPEHFADDEWIMCRR